MKWDWSHVIMLGSCSSSLFKGTNCTSIPSCGSRIFPPWHCSKPLAVWHIVSPWSLKKTTGRKSLQVIREQTDVSSWLKLFKKLVGLSVSGCPAVSTGRFEQQTPSRALGRTIVGLQLTMKPVSPLGIVAYPVLGAVGSTSANPDVSKVLKLL